MELLPSERVILQVMGRATRPHACGLAAIQGLRIQTNSARFFAQGASLGGVLTAPGAISDETAKRLKAYWEEAQPSLWIH